MNYRSLVLLLLIFLAAIPSFAVTRTSNGGNWSTPATWGGIVPAPGDDVVLASGTTNVDAGLAASTTIQSLTINGTAILDFVAANKTIVVTLITTMNGNTLLDNSPNNNGGNKILSMLGDFNIPALQAARIDGITLTQPVAKNFTVSGNFQPTNNKGTKTLGNLIINKTGSWTATSNETYTFQGTTDLYEGCLISGASTGIITMNGNLTVRTSAPAGSHVQIGAISLNVNGTTTVIGYWEFTLSASGTKTFNNTITVAVGGTWDNIAGEDPVVNCSIVNKGNWPVPAGPSNGRYDVNAGGSYTYSGPNSIGMNRLRVQGGSTVTNLGKIEVTRTGSQGLTATAGTFINGAGSYLKLTSEPTPVTAGSNVDFTAVNNIVDYTFAGNQDVFPTTYDKMEANSGGTKTISGGTAVNTSVTITGTTVLAVAGGTNLTGAGNIIMHNTSILSLGYNAAILPELTGASNVLDPGTTIEFGGAGAFGLRRSSLLPYQNVIIDGAVGSNANFSADATGVTAILGDLTYNVAGRSTVNPALSVTGTFTYSSSATSILTNNVSVGSFLTTSGIINFSGKVMTINGTGGLWENDGGSFTAPGPSVTFTTGASQEIRGTSVTTFSNLVINNATADVALSVNAIIGTSLTFISHNIVTDIYSVIAGPAIPITASAATGWVNGNFRRLINAAGSPTVVFPIGTSTAYAPASLTLNSVTNTTGFFTMFVTNNDSPDIYSGLFEPSRTVNRYWSIRNSDAVTPLVMFTSMDATVNFLVSDYPGALDFTKVSIRAYDNVALSWTDIATPPPSITSTATSASWTAFPAANFPLDTQMDIEIGQKINPTSVLNRVSNGTFNWSLATTWIQYRTGSIQLTTGSKLVTGLATTFTTELQVGDVLMTVLLPAGATYTVASITDDTNLVLIANSGATSLGSFGRQHVPGNCSGCAVPNDTDTDAVLIGNQFLANAGNTIINQDLVYAKILTLDINTAGGPIARAQTLQHIGTDSLLVLANATVSQPGANALTDAWNIDAGAATIQGDLTIGSTNNANVTRIGKVNLTTGKIHTDNLKFKTAAGAGREAQAVLAMGNNSKIYVSGGISFVPNLRGTLTSAFGAPGSTFVYNKAAGAQTFTVPGGSAAAFLYNNLWSQNKSATGLLVATTLDGTAVTGNVQGNIEVHNGAWLQLGGAATIVGNNTKTFTVFPGGTFEIITSAANPVFPQNYTFSLGTVAPFGTVIYNSNAARNIAAQAYGHLMVVNQPPAITANRSYTLPNATVTVNGDFTLGDAVAAFVPTLAGTGASTLLDVKGNLNVLQGTLNATNIPVINIGANWANAGTFTPSTGTVTFNGLTASQPQLITNSSGETFYNLTLATDQNTDKIKMINPVTVTNTLTLTQGGLVLNGNLLNITRKSNAAISRVNPAYILGENLVPTYGPSGSVRWLVDNQSGIFTWPFGKDQNTYIPFILNVTGAGSANPVNTGTFEVFTYGTASDNQPIVPSGAGNLTGTSGGASVVDRFWNIALNNYVGAGATRPTSTVTFTATLTEFTGTGLNQALPNSFTTAPPQAAFAAQRWDPANYWDAAVPTQNYTPNAPTGSVVMTGISNYAPAWTIANQAVPLPIELTLFNAQFESGFVNINWKTETELNNNFFMVQKTKDAELYEDVIEVKGAGTTTSPKSYATIDNHPIPGTWYYRLKQTDYDGRYTFSKLVAVNVPETVAWIVYPNPSNGYEFNINFSQKDLGKTAFVKLHDIGGREMLQLHTENLTSTNLKVETPQKLSPGIYIISIAVDQDIVRQKLIVNK